MVKLNQFYDFFLFYKCSCQVPSNFTSYEAQSETNLAFPYLCGRHQLTGNTKKLDAKSKNIFFITTLFNFKIVIQVDFRWFIGVFLKN